MELLQEMFHTFQRPETRHAALVHFPVALGTLAVVVTLIAAFWGPRRPHLRWLATVTMALLAAVALLASLSGEAAHEAIEGVFSSAGAATVHDHEEAGEKLWIFALIATVLLAVSTRHVRRPAKGEPPATAPQKAAAMVSQPTYALLCGWAAAAFALFIAGWTSYVGHLGGRLVYYHGAVVPVETRGGLKLDGDAGFADPRVEFFADRVAPVIEQCTFCHSNGGGDPASGLDLTTAGGMLRGGSRGPAVDPGNPQDSLMFQAIAHQHEELEMPPGGPLSDEQIDAIRRWIREGAVWLTRDRDTE